MSVAFESRSGERREERGEEKPPPPRKEKKNPADMYEDPGGQPGGNEYMEI